MPLEAPVPTAPEIAQSISAAFDSVNLCNAVIALSATADNVNSVRRNYQHLEIMLAKTWFAEALTVEQASAIDTVIADSIAYVG